MSANLSYCNYNETCIHAITVKAGSQYDVGSVSVLSIANVTEESH